MMNLLSLVSSSYTIIHICINGNKKGLAINLRILLKPQSHDRQQFHISYSPQQSIKPGFHQDSEL
ncbi:hypothetical protein UUU_31150 [Klebsiella pneumoniae subsp. pneumoniae DSM 30104 = JCM 1662 = NBRC 14940]|nr:hypothetical protein UUU_31150 [Klebsiella pneumoniae subsp. pneumoniae DSM 30104 = JCM 1662 = NBRC 14940]